MAALARFVSQSAIIFALRLIGAGLIFLVQAAMARSWGADVLGHYLLIVAAVNLLAVFMPLGFQVIGTYFAAEYRASHHASLLKTFARRAYTHIALVSAVATIVGAVFEARLATSYPAIARLWMPTMLMATATAIVFVNGALLVGMKRAISGFIADTLFKPLVMVSGFLVAYALAEGTARLSTLIWTAALAYAGIAMIHAGFVVIELRHLQDQGAAPAREPARWWRFALPWVIIAVATDFFFDIDLLLLSHLLSIEDLAVFGVCTRIFSLVAFGVAAVYAVTMPDFLEAKRQHGDSRFYRKMTEANLVAACLAAIAACAMLFAGPVLTLFGPAFAAGAAPLAILCVGLTIRSIAGPAALVLSIHDKPYASLPPVALGLAALVLGNLAFVPRYGIMGAAIAASLAMVLWSLAQWLVALKHTGTDVSIWPRLREALGGPRLH
ncbi:lipopolysaccharide biosynthesis protein [Afipia sp. TerB]